MPTLKISMTVVWVLALILLMLNVAVIPSAFARLAIFWFIFGLAWSPWAYPGWLFIERIASGDINPRAKKILQSVDKFGFVIAWIISAYYFSRTALL